MFYSWADVKLHERFLDNLDDESVRERTRLATVALFDLVERSRCRHQALVAHFDEVIGPCGSSCDVCTGHRTDERIAELVASQVGTARARRAAVSGTSGGTGSRTSRGSDAAMLDDDDKELFERLRVVRRELADEAGVPAYIVFGDKVLLEMVARRPGSSRELLQVPGVGEAKLERYGAAFLDVLRE
jgi:ATP-dependent DNA helicase RecQ